jgi:hypothetical protein
LEGYGKRKDCLASDNAVDDAVNAQRLNIVEADVFYFKVLY